MSEATEPTGARPRRSARPTLRDVAREAGLSVTQASRALNDHADVAEATKVRAREAAAQLGYTPNLQARRLRDPKARTDSLGMILPAETLALSDPFFGDLLAAIAAEAGVRGLQLNLWTPPADVTVIEPYATAIRNQRVDGFVLVCAESGDPRIGYLLDRSFPFVALGRPDERTGFCSVELSGAGIRAAVDHLIGLGHRRIGCIAEPARFAMAAQRLKIFREAIATHKLDPGSAPIVGDGFDEASGLAATRGLLAGPDRPTAVLALNDLLALGAMQAAAELGLSVPDDISVIGSDNIAFAALASPALTTIRLDATEVGAGLVQELVTAIEAGSPQPGSRKVSSTLVIRQSTGPAPA